MLVDLRADEQARFHAEIDKHQWLGHRMVGETMRYVATDANDEWVALVGFASPALTCTPRDRFISWSSELGCRRLRFVASNQRFSVLLSLSSITGKCPARTRSGHHRPGSTMGQPASERNWSRADEPRDTRDSEVIA
jgi:hypothetical protein